jgi:hypothetical protein
MLIIVIIVTAVPAETAKKPGQPLQQQGLPQFEPGKEPIGVSPMIHLNLESTV